MSQAEGDNFYNRPMLLYIAGALIGIVNIPRLLGLISAFFVISIRGINEATLRTHGLTSFIVNYGGITGLVESVSLLVCAFFLVLQRVWARKLLLWLIPIFLVHYTIYMILIGQVRSWLFFRAGCDVAALLIIYIFHKKAISSSPSRQTP